MFKENKYTRWYFQIVGKRRIDQVDGYSENHHIIPKCLGGDDSSENLVKLTAREHFLCHWLLTKMNNSNKLKFALVSMSLINPHQEERRSLSRHYEMIKKINSLASKERMVGFSGHNGGKKLYHNPETGEGIMLGKDSAVPAGFVLGKSERSRSLISEKNSGRVYFHKGDEVIALKQDETPPEGFVRGNPKASHQSSMRGSAYYFNPITGEEVRTKNPPDGFIKGRNSIWVTNGLENKLINRSNGNIQDGWKLGKTHRKATNEL